MKNGLELNDRFVFVESIISACKHLDIDPLFITNNRNLDKFVHHFLEGELKYPTQLLVGEGSLHKCAQEFSSSLETELTSNSIPVHNTVESAYNLTKTTTASTKIDISTIELGAINGCLKLQNLPEVVISTTDVEADIATKQQERIQLQLEYEEATQKLTEAGDELVLANKEVDECTHANMLLNQSLQSMEMSLSSLNQQHTALLVATHTNSQETTDARATAIAAITAVIAPLRERITQTRALFTDSSTALATARSNRTDAQSRVTAATRDKNTKSRELRTLAGKVTLLQSDNKRGYVKAVDRMIPTAFNHDLSSCLHDERLQQYRKLGNTNSVTRLPGMPYISDGGLMRISELYLLSINLNDNFEPM